MNVYSVYVLIWQRMQTHSKVLCRAFRYSTLRVTLAFFAVHHLHLHFLPYIYVSFFLSVYDKETVVDLFSAMNDGDVDAATYVNAFIDYSFKKYLCDFVPAVVHIRHPIWRSHDTRSQGHKICVVAVA